MQLTISIFGALFNKFQDEKNVLVQINPVKTRNAMWLVYQHFISSSRPPTPHQGYYHNRPKSAVGSAVLGPTKLDVPATNGTSGNVGVKGRAAFDAFQAGVTLSTCGCRHGQGCSKRL